MLPSSDFVSYLCLWQYFYQMEMFHVTSFCTTACVPVSFQSQISQLATSTGGFYILLKTWNAPLARFLLITYQIRIWKYVDDNGNIRELQYSGWLLSNQRFSFGKGLHLQAAFKINSRPPRPAAADKSAITANKQHIHQLCSPNLNEKNSKGCDWFLEQTFHGDKCKVQGIFVTSKVHKCMGGGSKAINKVCWEQGGRILGAPLQQHQSLRDSSL